MCRCSPRRGGYQTHLRAAKQPSIAPGVVGFNPFISTVIKIPIRTVNKEINADLPSKEGLTIASEISILYRVDPAKTPEILQQVGLNYDNALILPVFRSAAADITARYFAKDMHSGERDQIEKAIRQRMMSELSERGFIIEAVLMKSIRLPQGLARAIEEKLEAEQDAQRMKFVLEREQLEAQRKKIEAEGERDAQRIISEGLNPLIISFKTIEAFRMLANSPNTKIIITDGKTPLLIQTEKQ
ncbi:MAG: prohibitin family protein [Cytophagales bacterium]|nr:prohibitin family protein [Cytophagales bacterium]